jgi:hypothetical protein
MTNTPDYSEFQKNRKVPGRWQDLVDSLQQGVPALVEIPDGKQEKSVRASIYNAAKRANRKVTFLNKKDGNVWVCWMID